ncbi:MAG: c-type cytochrome [Gammaproteobacteria bacterium]|nr:c-type cytochrome [Gammaproteobacteria bacterium]MDH5799892.1 c-type cytochrome [Gammaproteobacteria bacterium]
MRSKTIMHGLSQCSLPYCALVAVCASVIMLSLYKNATAHDHDVLLLNEPVQPIPVIDIDRRKFSLGESLFHEKQLDRHERKSCSSCHDLSKGGSDGKTTSRPLNPEEPRSKEVNTPTIFNVKFNDSYYWNGLFESLDEQLDDALLELNDSWQILASRLAHIPSYERKFNLLYSDGITATNIKDALSYYVASLSTPNSPFDQYLRGKPKAIDEKQKTGYRLFKQHGCIVCHQGINVGGNLTLPLAEITLDKFSPALGNTLTDRNSGKNNKIRVPSLRNVALTAPYLHDGSAATLEGAVNHMSRQAPGLSIPKQDTDLIIRFLKSLTGEYNGQML